MQLSFAQSIVQCLVGVSEMGPGVLWSSTILVLSAPLLQLHSMWVVLCCRCLQKSGRNTGRDNSDYSDIQLSDNNQQLVSQEGKTPLVLTFLHLILILHSVSKIGSLLAK